MRRDLKYSCLCLDDVFPSKQPLPPIGETSERPATGRDTVRVGISACLNRHHPPLPNMTGGNPPSLSTKSCTEDVIGAHKMFIYFRLNCLYIYIQSHKDALF